MMAARNDPDRNVQRMRRRYAVRDALKQFVGRVSGGRENKLYGGYLRFIACTRRVLGGTASVQTFEARLPEATGKGHIRVRISLPEMPRGNVYAFADHVVDEEGKATDCVLATCVGGFAISEDLGGHWRPVVLPQFS